MSIGGPEIVVVLVVAVLNLFWLWMVRDCLENPGLNGHERFYWIALMAITHVLGALSYWLNHARWQRTAAHSRG